MANMTRTLADTSGFIPEAWAQRGLDLLRPKLPLVRNVVRDADFEPGWKGKTLNISYVGTCTAADKAEDTDASVSVPSGGTKKQVSLAYLSYVDIIVEDYAEAQANATIMDRLVTPMIDAIAKRIEAKAWALVANMTAATDSAYGTDLSIGQIRKCSKDLNDYDVPSADRFIVCATKDELALKNDTNLATYFATSRPDIIEKGAFSELDGFAMHSSTQVPAVVATPVQTKCFAGHKEAMIFATRPMRDPPANSGVQAASIVDIDTGLSLRVLYQYTMAGRGVRLGLDILYGLAALRTGAGFLLKT